MAGCETDFLCTLTTRRHTKKKRMANHLCETNVTRLLLMSMHVLLLIFSFSHCVHFFYKKTCLKRGNGLAETFFRHNHYCHACHTEFAVFFPILPSYSVSLLKQSKNPPLLVGSHLHSKQFP